MSNPNIDVTLDVRNSPAQPNDGYTDTTASNNAVYCYQYGGGSDGHGTVEETAEAGAGTITVVVGGDPRYQIDHVDFGGDIQSQLSWAPGPSPNTAVITDTDTSSGDGYYKVVVKDTSANCTFPCDPAIKNKPAGSNN